MRRTHVVKAGEPSTRMSEPSQPLDIIQVGILEKPDYSTEIIEKYQSGSSASDIANLFYCSKQTKLSVLKKNKINMRPVKICTTRTAVLKQRAKSGAKLFYGFCYLGGVLTKTR